MRGQRAASGGRGDLGEAKGRRAPGAAQALVPFAPRWDGAAGSWGHTQDQALLRHHWFLC